MLRNRDTKNYFKVFYIRRTCRILPAYVILLATYFGAIVLGWSALPQFTWLFSNPLPDYSYLTFTQNILMGVRETFGAAWLIPTWSLAVEEQFYLIVPALALLARGRFAKIALLAFLAAPALRFAFPGFHTYVASPFRADSLAAGVLLAMAFESLPMRAWITEHGSTLRRTLATMGALTIVLTFYPILGALEFSWLAVLYGLGITVVLAESDGRLAQVMRLRPLRWVGMRSYGIYLFHLPVLGIVQGLRGHTLPELLGWADIAATGLALALSLVVAAVLYRLVEEPFIALGQRSR